MLRVGRNGAAPDPAATSAPDSGNAAASWLAWDAAQIGARLIGLTFLLIAVWQIRAQVRERVAVAGVAFRVQDLAPRPSAVPAARSRPPVSQPPGLTPGGLTPAGLAAAGRSTRRTAPTH